MLKGKAKRDYFSKLLIFITYTEFSLRKKVILCKVLAFFQTDPFTVTTMMQGTFNSRPNVLRDTSLLSGI